MELNSAMTCVNMVNSVFWLRVNSAFWLSRDSDQVSKLWPEGQTQTSA